MLQLDCSTIFTVAVTGVLILVCVVTSGSANAQTSNAELKEKIEEKSEKIKEVKQTIDKYESKLSQTRQKSNTLASTLQSLDQSIDSLRQRLETTQQKINATQQTIAELTQKIRQKRSEITSTRESLGAAVRALRIANTNTLIESLLSAGSLANMWKRQDNLMQIQAGLHDRTEKLQKLQVSLQAKKQAAARKQEQLQDLQSRLASQRKVIRNQQQQKKQLLAQTNRKEKEYQKLLAKKREQKKKFQQQLRRFENKLQSTVSSGSIPGPNEASFTWPVQPVRITQRFGGTAFAKRNPSAYGRPFHNGTDFGVPVGTPVHPVAGGTVRDSGNTDAYPDCLSYGKWILIDHGNGLSTLYAHLSAINATDGEAVTPESVIGYSGNTGYSTGPHLHLTTYATGDVNVTELGKVKTNTNCGNAAIPVAPTESYLNPGKYLP